MTEFKLWCSEATALPTEPQPLPNAGLLFVCASNISLFFHLASVAASRQRANSEWVSVALILDYGKIITLKGDYTTL